VLRPTKFVFRPSNFPKGFQLFVFLVYRNSGLRLSSPFFQLAWSTFIPVCIVTYLQFLSDLFSLVILARVAATDLIKWGAAVAV